jgi:hypothetical protein
MVYDVTKRNLDDLRSNTPSNKLVKDPLDFKWGLRYLKKEYSDRSIWRTEVPFAEQTSHCLPV